jgi:hypothetical protein
MLKFTGDIAQTVELLRTAPEELCEPVITKFFKETNDWDFTALNVLEKIDRVVHAGLACELWVKLANHFLDQLIEIEQTTFAEVEAKATWRN